MRKILITSALPYANGDLHVGHLLGYINADIWRRFQQLIGNICAHICGIDSHGTAIMIAAQNNQISPDKLVDHMKIEHLKVFQSFQVEFSSYDSTNSRTHRDSVYDLYQILLSQELVYKKKVLQAFDVKCKMFLPDRFLKGECPFCSAQDQYGDGCEGCGKVYQTTDIINPYSVISNTKPIFLESVNYFFKLQSFLTPLQEKTATLLSPAWTSYITTWFNEGLKDWSISRDKPYYGFEIPDTNQEKYFYVWFDAPVSYISFCKSVVIDGISLADYWLPNSDAEIYQYIGKDIVYFHALFWLALLIAWGKKLPTKFIVNGFVNLNKHKISKSRNALLSAQQVHQVLGSNALRYYFASKSQDGSDDINLDLKSLQHTINKNLIGKILNIANRCAYFLETYFDNTLSDNINLNHDIIMQRYVISETIKDLYEKRQFCLVIKEIDVLATNANQLFNAWEPWRLVKTDLLKTHDVLSTVMNIFKMITGYLVPIVPDLSMKILTFLNTRVDSWNEINSLLMGHKINRFHSVLSKITDEDIQNLQGV